MISRALAAFAVGLLFSAGLAISGMTQPEKVIGFLDLFGAWDPSLIFVMGGALAVHLVTYRMIRRRSTPMLDKQWHVPTKTALTKPLVFGGVLFGAGWALAGLCPGPALVALATGNKSVLVFVGAMLAGMLVFQVADRVIRFNR
jgi:hypothetical protein